VGKKEFDPTITKEGQIMLVLSRKLGEEIIIAGNIRVKVVGIQGNRVKLGVVAPEEVAVHREEVQRTRMEFAETSADPIEAVIMN
jgi:carbon storage regulator